MVVLGNTAETLAFAEKVPWISVINYGGIAQKKAHSSSARPYT